MKQVYLSIVVPCYDEMANLRKGVLDKMAHYLNKQKYSYEVIIIDDGSKDGSKEFIKEYVKEYPSFRLVESEHLGKAGAVTKGMLQAEGEQVLFTDMDQATPIEEISKLLPYVLEKYDIVIGSRGMHREGAPLSRRFISIGSIILRKLVIGLGDIKDTQCGFKLFNKNASEKIFKKIYDLHNGFKEIHGSAVTAGFDMELLFLAKKLGYRIKEVPVNWLYVESRRVSPLRDSIAAVIDLLKIKRNDISGKYS